MPNIGITELLVILAIAFVIFGAKRLPELGAGLGKAIRSFNKGVKGEDEKEAKQVENKDEDQHLKS